MRLLPANKNLGWTPYVWLSYLSFLLVYPYFSGSSPQVWVITAASIAVFLPVYFRGWWVRGTRLLPYIGVLLLLGTLTVPINPGGSVYFIYAASFGGLVGSLHRAIRLVVAIALLVALEAWVMSLPPGVWIPGVFFSLVVGLPNAYFAEASRADARLRLAHEEIERLATTAERERIARDLHDVLGHTLSLITLKAELAARLVESDPVRAEQEAREIERISRAAMQEVRETVRGYRAAGLASELANAHLALEAAGIALEVVGDVSALPPRVDAALAMALREAVTNVVRHAGASSCRVSCERDASQVRLAITDDGRGGDSFEGGGLTGMRERITELGGTFERDGRSGTRLELSLPLPSVESATEPRPLRRAG